MDRLIGGLALALLSAAAINLGFLLQHRGLRRRAPAGGGIVAAVRGALHSPAWLGGQVVGWTGFGGQIVAISLAPLSLVQATAAGGLVLSLPLAARWFGHRVSAPQARAVGVATAGLVVLPIAVRAGAEHFDEGTLILAVLAALALATPAGWARTAVPRAAAAGVLYGIADAAIKAASIALAHGSAAPLYSWATVAALATFLGFLSFQAALRAGDALTAISLMTIVTALLALALGTLGFHESLGATPVPLSVHLAAVALILSSVPALAAAQIPSRDQSKQPLNINDGAGSTCMSERALGGVKSRSRRG